MADSPSVNLIPDEQEHSPERHESPTPAADSAMLAPVDASAPKFLGKGRKAKADKLAKRAYTTADNDPLNRYIARRRAQSILALKLEGRKPSEIAEELNIPVKSVYWALYQLRRGGHLQPAEEVVDAMDRIIKPLVMERLEERLSDPRVSDEMIVATAKGTGIFVDHAKVKNEGPNVLQQLVVKFDMPANGAAPVAIGEIHGTPLAVDGEVAS